jgi:hypothetical protein
MNISWSGPISISMPLIGSTRRPLRGVSALVGPTHTGGASSGDQILALRSLLADGSSGVGVFVTRMRYMSLRVWS